MSHCPFEIETPVFTRVQELGKRDLTPEIEMERKHPCTLLTPVPTKPLNKLLNCEDGELETDFFDDDSAN